MRVTLLLICSCLLMTSGALARTSEKQKIIQRGEYLVNLLACGRCHTEGYLAGNEATAPYMAGSTIGIAYTAYSEDETNPGVVFPGNLTPDPETGLGDWSERDIVRAMTLGITKNGHERLTVMPWPNYNALTSDDLSAIARYLQSLTPVTRRVPDSIPEGDPINQSYVRFGIYEFRAHHKDSPGTD